MTLLAHLPQPPHRYAYKIALVYGPKDAYERLVRHEAPFHLYHDIAEFHFHMNDYEACAPLFYPEGSTCIINIGSTTVFPSTLGYLPLFVLPL